MAKDRNASADEVGGDEATPIWALEDLYPDLDNLLSPSVVSAASSRDVLVVLDTNALLFPFKVGARDFSEIKAAFTRLADERRLRVPARVIREYLNNRDTQLGNLLKAVQDKASTLPSSGSNLPRFFKDMDGAAAAFDADQNLHKASREYAKALRPLIDRMKAWRGDDPVTVAYKKIFGPDVVVDCKFDRPTVARQWKTRLENKTPPGYKDSNKSDKGIGDFLIWLTILEIGRTSEKDIIFVTGDEKADWRVRSDNSGVYPRPELIDEYRRYTKGKNLRLLKLADLLEEVGAPKDVVEDVREAETLIIEEQSQIDGDDAFQFFDYSTNNGEMVIRLNGATFNWAFSKASDTCIHVYARGGSKVARCKNVAQNEVVDFNQFDNTSRAYTVHTGEVFLVRNTDGSTLAARIRSISDDTRGAPHDHVAFSYRTFGRGHKIVCP